MSRQWEGLPTPRLSPRVSQGLGKDGRERERERERELGTGTEKGWADGRCRQKAVGKCGAASKWGTFR